jgi:hypothetical protein
VRVLGFWAYVRALLLTHVFPRGRVASSFFQNAYAARSERAVPHGKLRFARRFHAPGIRGRRGSGRNDKARRSLPRFRGVRLGRLGVSGCHPTKPKDIATLFSYALPLASAPAGRIAFTVRRKDRPDDAIVDAEPGS